MKTNWNNNIYCILKVIISTTHKDTKANPCEIKVNARLHKNKIYLISAQQVSLLRRVLEDEHNAARVGCHPSPLNPVMIYKIRTLNNLIHKTSTDVFGIKNRHVWYAIRLKTYSLSFEKGIEMWDHYELLWDESYQYPWVEGTQPFFRASKRLQGFSR